MKYSIDASALIGGWIRYYPPDIMPDLWAGLEEMIKNGDLRATEEVFGEISKQQDELSKWVKTNKEMFVAIDNNIQMRVRTLLAQFPKLINVKKNKSMADPFVIALAQEIDKNGVVITGEKPKFIQRGIEPTIENKVKIPDVCKVFNIRCIDLLGLMRDMGWRFIRT